MEIKQNDTFEVIDMQTWSRAEEYKQYTELWTTVTSSVNVKISVAKMLPYIKEHGFKFVPTILWVVSQAVNRHKNFRYALKDGKLVNWNVMHPVFPTLNSDENISYHCVPFHEDYQTFYQNYLTEQAENIKKTDFWATKIPENSYIISILPWLEFEGSMQLKNSKGYYSPIFVVGKFNEEKILNIMITVNHATVDAWHIKLVFDEIQKLLDTPEEWCK